MYQFTENLETFCKKQGITYSELARRVGRSYHWLKELRSRGTTNLSTVYELAEALGVSAGTLLDGKQTHDDLTVDEAYNILFYKLSQNKSYHGVVLKQLSNWKKFYEREKHRSFSVWLTLQMNKRGWTVAKVAKNSQISDQKIHQILRCEVQIDNTVKILEDLFGEQFT